MYPYSVHILYKPGAQLYIADQLSHHKYIENSDGEIPKMNMTVHNISTLVDVPINTSIEDIQAAMEEDLEVHLLQRYIISGWPSTRKVVKPRLES